MIFNLFRKKTPQEITADKLYAQIVAQARQPVFYTDYKIPDDVNGRFELLILHSYMLFHRLRPEDEKTRVIGQAVFDRFFQDMDDSLRERGIGDLSIPKKIKKMAQAFYGRVEAYDTAREDGPDALALALSRNFFPESEEKQPQTDGLADYVYKSDAHLLGLSAKSIASGVLSYPDITPAPDIDLCASQDGNDGMGRAPSKASSEQGK